MTVPQPSSRATALLDDGQRELMLEEKAVPASRMPATISVAATRGKHVATTWVRVRPLLSHLGEGNDALLAGLQLVSSGKGVGGETRTDSVVALGGRTPIGGFTGILGMDETNEQVFERTFRDCLPAVMCGGTAALFCYGYTGAGKTHSVFGVEGDPGM